MTKDDPKRLSPYLTISTAPSWIERAVGIAKLQMGFQECYWSQTGYWRHSIGSKVPRLHHPKPSHIATEVETSGGFS